MIYYYYRSPHGPVADLPGEEWRDWEEFWEVSNLGRFKAKERIIESHRATRRQRERLLTLHNGGSKSREVLSVRYQRDGRAVSVSIYRAMWVAFKGAELEPDQHLCCVGPLRLENLVLKRGQPKRRRDRQP